MKTTSDSKLNQFLDLLFQPSDLIEIRPIETWDADGKKQSRPMTADRQWICRKDFNDATIATLADCNSRHHGNIFFGVNPRSNNTGTKAAIKSVTCLWADIDDCTFDAFKGKVNELALPKPTIAVNSGNGIHAYWVFHQPISIDSKATLNRIENTVGRLLEALGGKKMKGTQDVSRILRIPHAQFMNVKNARNGQAEKTVEIVHMEATLKYNIEDIETALPVTPVLSELEDFENEKPVEIKTDIPQNPANCSQAILDIVAELDLPTKDRSARDIAVIAKLKAAGIDVVDAWQLVANKSKFAGRDYKYFVSTWNAAVYVKEGTSMTHRHIVKHPFVTPSTNNTAVTYPLPLNLLPSPMKEMIEESIAVYGGNGGGALCWALATISAATGNLAQVHHIGKGWSPKHLPTSLYFSIVGDSGSNKTISGKDFVHPFNTSQTQATIEYAERKAKTNSVLSSLNAQITGKKAAISDATKKKDPIDELQEELAALEIQKNKIREELRGGSWAIDDATPEKVLMMMKRCYGRAAYLGSESRIIQNILGTSYGSGSSEHVALKAYDSETIKRDRVGNTADDPNSEIVVLSPTLTLLCTFTPDIWANLLTDKNFRNSGFLSRTMVVSVPPLSTNYYAKPIRTETLDKWNAVISALCCIPVDTDDNDNPQPFLLGLTDEAYQRHLNICTQIENNIRTKGTDCMPDDLKEWKNRFNTATLRLAALMHLFRHKDDYSNHKIGNTDIVLGWKLYQYFLGEFNALFTDDKDNTGNADKLMKWALKKNAAFQKQHAKDGIRFKGNAKKSEAAKETLATCLSNGWLCYDEANYVYSVTQEYKDWTKQQGI